MITMRPIYPMYYHITDTTFTKCQLQSVKAVIIPIKHWVNRVMLGLPSIINSLIHIHTLCHLDAKNRYAHVFFTLYFLG